ncbi:MAG: four helix bundle protein [Candidatus Hydrogenedentota bacterium]
MQSSFHCQRADSPSRSTPRFNLSALEHSTQIRKSYNSEISFLLALTPSTSTTPEGRTSRVSPCASVVQSHFAYLAKFPAEEKFGLTSQIRRAVASIPANIAEGAERNGTPEFLQFLGIASGSLAEVETFLALAERLKMTANEDLAPVWEQTKDVGRMINGLKRSLRSRS